MKCPKCKSVNTATERRLDGDSKCLDCGYKNKSSYFELLNKTSPKVEDKSVSYSIGKGFTGKEKHLYLWRSEDCSMSPIAKFMNANAVIKFSKEFGFPLSDSIKEKLKEIK